MPAPQSPVQGGGWEGLAGEGRCSLLGDGKPGKAVPFPPQECPSESGATAFPLGTCSTQLRLSEPSLFPSVKWKLWGIFVLWSVCE